MAERARQQGNEINFNEARSIRIERMNADLAARAAQYVDTGSLDIGYQPIWDYHTQIFENNSLTADA